MPRTLPAPVEPTRSLVQRASSVHTRDDLLHFVRAVRDDWEARPEVWCTVQLNQTVASVEAWVDRVDAHFGHTGRALADAPSWRALGERLLAARMSP